MNDYFVDRFTVSPLTILVHVTTKHQILTYQNCDLSSYDDILTYHDFDMLKLDAWTKFFAITKYSILSSFDGFSLFQ